jgi:hypothetical protein
LIESKFISRAATFTFFIGDRFFGVITAYVQGDNAGLYHFTSSLPVQIVKFLKPILSPLINNTSPAKELAPVIADVIVAKKSEPLEAKQVSVNVIKPLIEKPVVKVVKEWVENTSNKIPKPVVAPKPVSQKPEIRVVTVISKETADISNKPLPIIEPKIIKPALTQKANSTAKNDSATRYYKYPTPVIPKQ